MYRAALLISLAAGDVEKAIRCVGRFVRQQPENGLAISSAVPPRFIGTWSFTRSTRFGSPPLAWSSV